MRLRLKDGSFASGRLVPSVAADRVGWKVDGFVDAFEFDARALRSISVSMESADESNNDVEIAPGQRQMFELTDGGLLVGKLLAMDEEGIDVASDLLGQLRIARERVVTISDATFAGQIVYQGPLQEETWSSISDATDWIFEGGSAVTEKPGAVLVGDVKMPAKAQVDVALSWRGVPDFVFSFGTSATNRVSPAEQVPAAARLEVWDKQLALVREVDGGADIALISDLTGSSPRIELTLLIDQMAGVVTVCDVHGRPLDSVMASARRELVRDAVHLVNHGPSLTLESLEVREWDGRARSVGSTEGTVLTRDEQTLQARIRGYDAENGELLLSTKLADAPKTVSLSNLRRGDFELGASPGTEAESNSAGAGEQLEVIFVDRSRLRGKWLPGKDGMLVMRSPGVRSAEGHAGGGTGEIAFLPEQLRGVIGTEERFAGDAAEARNGTLKMDAVQLAGYLQETQPGAQETGLFWRAYASATASEISPQASGAIVYRRQLPRVTTPARGQQQTTRPNNAVPMINIFLGGQAPRQAPRENEEKPPSEPLANARQIMFRTGDAIDGVVERIDESGMTFQSQQTSTSFAAHGQIQSVSLNDQIRGAEFSDQQISRLMTVPRSMKSDPPTHLFVSITGDYLRGRLVRMDGDTLTAEIRLEMVELPTKQVAKIIWLHDRNWEEDKQAGADQQADESELAPFRVHVINSDERGLTFRPTRVEGGLIQGASELLGDCSVNIQDLSQVLFGRDIGLRVREFRQDPWTLSLAQYPRVYLDSEQGSDGGGLGSMSPLVNAPAPDFGLKTLGGEGFRLRTQRERVVVLDFWASWCGPCIQTMPLVEEVVAEFGADQVHLVAVNIQESADRVQAAVDRLGLSATVLLDIDGQVAAVYQANAIPQTVIIDREGTVRYVFVGGGSRFVAQFRDALADVLAVDGAQPATE